MGKLSGAKWVLLAWAAALWISGCGSNWTAISETNATDINTTIPEKVNHAPVLNNVEEIKLQTIEGTTVTLNLSQYKDRFSDPDGEMN